MVDKIGLLALGNDVIALLGNSGIIATNANVANLAANAVANNMDNDLNGFQLVGQRANVSNLNGIAYTLVSANTGRVFYFSNTIANIVVTCSGSANIGTSITCIQGNTKNVKFVAGTGADVFNRQGHQNTAGRYATVSLIVVVNANTTGANWILMGDTNT